MAAIGAGRRAARGWTVLLAIIVVTVIVLASVWLWYPCASTRTPVLTVSVNVEVDRFSGPPNAGPEGVEPDVAVAPNGTIGIAWIGVTPIVPTLYFNQTTNFTTGIWYAESSDGGLSFSRPVLVSGSCQQCVDPSIVYGHNGTVFICYLSTPSATHTVMMAYQLPGQTGFTNLSVATGPYLDRPWIKVASSGTLAVAYDSPNGIYLAQSPETSPSFSQAVLILNLEGIVASFGPAPSGGDYFGVLTDGQVNFATLPEGAMEATAPTTIPINVTGSLGTQAPVLSKPGPSVVESNSETFMAYVSNNDTSLWLVTSTDLGGTWGAPRLISAAGNGTLAMPELAVNPAGNALVIVWLGGNDGYWNTYAAALSPQSGTLSTTIRVSSENGYMNDVRSWHGDFLGVAFDGNFTAVTAWSDGRGGDSPDVGFGHIISSVLTVGS